MVEALKSRTKFTKSEQVTKIRKAKPFDSKRAIKGYETVQTTEQNRVAEKSCGLVVEAQINKSTTSSRLNTLPSKRFQWQLTPDRGTKPQPNCSRSEYRVSQSHCLTLMLQTQGTAD